MYDPVASITLREASHYSAMCGEAERIEAASAEADRKLNAVLNGIRKLDLTRAETHQILVTLAAAMQRKGYTDAQIEAVDCASEL